MVGFQNPIRDIMVNLLKKQREKSLNSEINGVFYTAQRTYNPSNHYIHSLVNYQSCQNIDRMMKWK